LRILGIDCGSRYTGYGVIDCRPGGHRLVEAGVIETRAADAFPRRLRVIGERLREVIAEFKPDEAAVEDTFTHLNARSALKLTHVRGVALFVLAEADIEVAEYAPARIKLTVAGNGNAPKQQVEWMTCALLGLTEPIDSLDASDAVAVALCHAALRGVRAAS
jgi:crossover junction endodeoxyribonuclease RuvC